MFEALQGRLQQIVQRLRGRGALSEADVDAALRDVRMALLEADVNFKVAKAFTERVRTAALGSQVLAHLAPGQQVVKIVYEELVRLLGGATRELHFADRPPTVILLVGLNGVGKTTTAGKLAARLAKGGRRPVLVATDLRRPAAVTQLQLVGAQVGVPVFTQPGVPDPAAIATAAIADAGRKAHDVVIIDSAGRQQIDEALMMELKTLRDAVSPHDVLLVVDAMTGQEAVNVAQRFDDMLHVDGLIVTKLDGDARGGAILSAVEVTGRPVMFTGVGEKLEALEPFHPDRMASRILGMGDVLTFIEKAQEAVDQQTAAELERKLRRAEFTLEDFRLQLRQVRNLGPLESLVEMLPGAARAKGPVPMLNEKALRRVEAIIGSMTLQERDQPQIIDGSRRRRIASGSGTTIQEVNRLLKQFAEARKLIKQMGQFEKKGRRGWPFSLPG